MPTPYFNPDPFVQAKAEVAGKTWNEQILHSRLLHNGRSAISSKGSAASKAIGAATSIGKLFLALIPVPVVGAISSAIVDTVSDAVRGKVRESQLSGAITPEEAAKFEIKDLTIENLDRYRWKLAHAFEALNDGIREYNSSDETCDNMYRLALLIEQVERRKDKLKKELEHFNDVLTLVNNWIVDVDATQGKNLHDVKEKLKKKNDDRAKVVNTSTSNQVAALIATEHGNCERWCCVKKEAKYQYNPAQWQDVKQWAGKVSMAATPVVFAAVTVKSDDYQIESK
ncbi:hypothetical protein CFB82_39750 [Burkholderia sp. HI2714]|uniref:hypothetical protein n=1 Tax=Burkholderia sp. HI2714 TaxID=2015359 RepID=UPI000B7A763D|nr:hypothetical protein [Burkholderia sp. HI2714]OXJ22608.1 hypothetical protein CFB82_39750 [Burkholderia sp. HI2714]